MIDWKEVLNIKKERKYGNEILKKWGAVKKRLNNIQKEINLIKNNHDYLTYAGFISEHAEIKSTYEKVLNELLNQIDNLILEFVKINLVLNQLPEIERKVIYLRYVKKYAWEKIAMETYTSRTNCFNIKNKVIDMLIEEENCEY